MPMKGLLTPASFPSFPVAHVRFPGGEQRRSRGVKRPLGREGGLRQGLLPGFPWPDRVFHFSALASVEKSLCGCSERSLT